MITRLLCVVYASGALAGACALTTPAFAQASMPTLPALPSPEEKEVPAADHTAVQSLPTPAYDRAHYEEDRARWLDDCRRLYKGSGLGGALIGGAALGAVAGDTIDKAGDDKRTHDACEAYLEHYSSAYPAAPSTYPGYANAYGHGPSGHGYPAAYPGPYPAFPDSSFTSARPCGYGPVAYIYVPTWVPVSTHRAKRVLDKEVEDSAHETEAAPAANKRIKIIPVK